MDQKRKDEIIKQFARLINESDRVEMHDEMDYTFKRTAYGSMVPDEKGQTHLTITFDLFKFGLFKS